MKSTLKVTDDGDDIDDDSGRVSPPYGVVQPPELPQRSDLDLKRSTTSFFCTLHFVISTIGCDAEI